MNTPIKNPYISNSGHGNLPPGSGSSVSALSRVGLIITFAMANGLVLVAVIFLFISDGEQPADQDPVMLDTILLGAGIVIAVLSCAGAVVFPMLQRGRAISDFQATGEKIDLPVDKDAPVGPAAQRLLGGSQTWTLVGQALMEGAGMINLILMFVDDQLLHLIPALVCLVGIVLLAPTTGRLTALLEDAAR